MPSPGQHGSYCQQVLEALALGEDIPEQEDYGTRPDNEAILRAAGPEIDAFRVREHCSLMLEENDCACGLHSILPLTP